ncbi:helix-turn-helix domain-containing protein [Bradyrhizobium sp. ISRA443]|uniref:helix-turn-helix domain-containing protein n=1 Tax=unclassified Bradyrhizobium TaxID=2631580 RepID=UPI00247A6329|nr:MULTISPECIES: hypothetical protein [unclassified Bradyrhizobium]WGR94083.1 helix-turn-helix domain-containing protein [Bradyrhizobium sp. ISRA435]WGR98727.1 helix-turn-helix domain-containing protein [Bradyrhizobium sp. ISRA436]WGS05617.1 helix-turn-helix domain-containing protein [Bradyrhizobium sp. ISRA437]WGS12504.1 helix-turn-helix domain-containing protein [Bradyrhizobium sp. ISRA443]
MSLIADCLKASSAFMVSFRVSLVFGETISDIAGAKAPGGAATAGGGTFASRAARGRVAADRCAQIRAARGMLNWSVKYLAGRTGISSAIIRRLEEHNDTAPTRDETMEVLRNTFSDAGIEILVFAGRQAKCPTTIRALNFCRRLAGWLSSCDLCRFRVKVRANFAIFDLVAVRKRSFLRA